MSGNGSATFNKTEIINNTQSFTLKKGGSANLTITPDNGYRVKSLKVDNLDMTSSINNNQYSINNISANTSINIEFEVIPATTYTLTITVTGNGTANYNNTSIKNKTASFTINEGAFATLSFTPDNGYRVKSLQVGNVDKKADITNNQYTTSKITANTTIVVDFEAIPKTNYTLTIKSTGNGSVSYDNTTVKNGSADFSVPEGTTAAILFSVDEGYKIKSLKVDEKDATSSITNNKYIIENIASNMVVEIEFEKIPDSTYSITITANGDGEVKASSTGSDYTYTIRDEKRVYYITKGADVSLEITPDEGCQFKLTMGDEVITSQSVYNLSLTKISEDVDLVVEFETIPKSEYTLSISAKGNGTVVYGNESVKNNSAKFTQEKGSSATITINPDKGYRVKSLTVNNTDVKPYISNNQYTITNINTDINLEVEFEEVIEDQYKFTIKSSGNGIVVLKSDTIRNKTTDIYIDKGSALKIQFIPDDGFGIISVHLDEVEILSNITEAIDYNMMSNDITGDMKFTAVFGELDKSLAVDGINYSIESFGEQTVKLSNGDYGLILEIPATITANDKDWKVVGVESEAFKDATELAAIIWNPEYNFTEPVSNPNLLLYVKSSDYAPSDIKNVIVNNKAKSITLTDAASGNNFYCPQQFTAEQITYEHNYSMKTGFNTCQGWETIVLPFDVAVVTNNTGTELVPYNKWTRGSSQKPFWLYHLDDSDWLPADTIKANTPYIISMPNNDNYNAVYNISGDVVFSASNAVVKASDDLAYSHHNHLNLIPNYQNQEKASEIYALNVNNLWDKNTESDMVEGSAFVRGLRQVRPFEAYMTIDSGGAATRSISIFGDGNTTGIMDIPKSDNKNGVVKVYSLSGVLIKQGAGSEVMQLPKGIYIINNRKVVVE